MNPPGGHATEAIANSAKRQAYEPKPDPWSADPNVAAATSSNSAVTLAAPIDAPAVSRPVEVAAQPEAIAPTQAQPEPVTEAEVVEAAPAAESNPVQTEVAQEASAVEPASDSISSALPFPPETAVEPSIQTAAAESMELPAAVSPVPSNEPAIAAQDVAAPLDTPQEVPLAVLSDRIELPPEIDAESESLTSSKIEHETERVSLAETMQSANLERSRDIVAVVPDPPKAAQAAQPKVSEKAIAKPSVSDGPKPAASDKPSVTNATTTPKLPVDPSTADDPPVPQPAAEPEPSRPTDPKPKPPEPKPSEPKSVEAQKDPSEKKSPVKDVAKPPAMTTTPTPPAEPAVANPARSVEFPRWTSKVSPGLTTPRSPSAASPGVPNKVLPAPTKARPEPLTTSPSVPQKAQPTVDPNGDPRRIPIWSPYNNLSPYPQPELAAPSKGKPSESPTAGWKIPHSPSKQAPDRPGMTAVPSKVFPSPQTAMAATGTPSILANRDRVVGSYDLNALFPATYHGATTRGTPPIQPAGSNAIAYGSSPSPKRKSILGRFLARFQREEDDTPVPTAADAIAGRVNPRGLWIEKPVRPSPTSIASEPGDIPQRGESIQRVSANGLNEPPQR